MPSRVPVLWHKASLRTDSMTAGSLLRCSGGDDVLDLMPRQEAADEAANEDLEAAGLLGEADERALEDPATHSAHELGVLRVARQR